MAKIVTITNPLTGQPAQVDQLDHTAQQIDDGLDIARGVSNPNLLDNWYFGKPIDQRGGYVYPPNSPYADSSGNQIGATSQYLTIDKSKKSPFSDDWAEISIDGTTYYGYIQYAVRGYTGAGMTVDRWRVEFCGDNSAVTINDVHISFVVNNSAMRFTQTDEKKYYGMYGTVSILTKTDLYSFSGFIFGMATGGIDVGVGNFYSITDNSGKIINIIDFSVGTHDVLAVKLELGSQQTLAHQENGNWVLNEIPDYGEQLARCQRFRFQPDTYWGAAMLALNTFALWGSIQFPVTMREIPGIEKVSVRNMHTGAETDISAYVVDVQRNENGITYLSCYGNDVFTANNWYQIKFSANADL